MCFIINFHLRILHMRVPFLLLTQIWIQMELPHQVCYLYFCLGSTRSYSCRLVGVLQLRYICLGSKSGLLLMARWMCLIVIYFWYDLFWRSKKRFHNRELLPIVLVLLRCDNPSSLVVEPTLSSFLRFCCSSSSFEKSFCVEVLGFPH